jgi:uncharacterized protein
VLAATVAPAAAGPLRNQMTGHPSPYLAMHARDPVAWQEWNPEALARARREDKLVYVSIGYFSCHWCHVMQRESYQNEAIARTLNANFIPVKVDRELEPALDARLIEFAEATTGRAGWPLNVFLTPEGHPLFAVLYLPPDNFLQVLDRLHSLWVNDRANLRQMARTEDTARITPGPSQLDRETVADHVRGLLKAAQELADPVNGGFGNQNKFPSAPQLMALLDQYARRPDPDLRAFLVLTLDHMAGKALFDRIGGGFFRYTVDPGWTIPHFEKMLYDNALLARVYLRAASTLGRKDYETVAVRTLDFMIRDMLGSRPAMVASFSAVDSRNLEGGYYLFPADQLASLLTDEEREVTTRALGMRGEARFKAGYLPQSGESLESIASSLGLERAVVDTLLARGMEKLRATRAARALPTDTKLLAGWNGLALTTLAEAADALGSSNYRAAASKIRDYLVKVLWDSGKLRRAVDGGRALGQVALEDYAYVAEGLAAWARVTNSMVDWDLASALTDDAWRIFHVNGGWRLSESSVLDLTGVAPVVSDGPMPSPSATLVQITLMLDQRRGDKQGRRDALSALNTGHARVAENPFWYATQISAMVQAVTGAP